MLISIVIAAHNRPLLLLEAIRSIAEQTYRNYEVVVIDDGSAPPVSRAQLEGALKQSIHLYRHDVALGVPKSKNAGINVARGEVILLLDDDDLLTSDALETIFHAFSNHPQIDCLFMGVHPFGPYAEGSVRRRASGLKRILDLSMPDERDELYFFSDRLFDALLTTVPIDFQRPAARRGLWNIAGGFDENCLFSESAWAIRVSCIGTVALTKKPLTRWRIHDTNFGWPSELEANNARIRQMDNAVIAGARLLAGFTSNADEWRIRAKKLKKHYSDALFAKAYYLRQSDLKVGAQALVRSLVLAPRIKHLRLMISYFVPKRWLERRSVVDIGE